MAAWRGHGDQRCRSDRQRAGRSRLSASTARLVSVAAPDRLDSKQRGFQKITAQHGEDPLHRRTADEHPRGSPAGPHAKPHFVIARHGHGALKVDRAAALARRRLPWLVRVRCEEAAEWSRRESGVTSRCDPQLSLPPAPRSLTTTKLFRGDCFRYSAEVAPARVHETLIAH
jgi:hypothetical protein